MQSKREKRMDGLKQKDTEIDLQKEIWTDAEQQRKKDGCTETERYRD